MRFLRIFRLALLMAFAGPALASEPLTDVTIYVDGPLLKRGGTVFVVPRAVSPERWTPAPDLPNPARSDPRLDRRKPIGSADRRLAVRLSARVGVVRFDHMRGGRYEFRFLPAPETGVPPERLGTMLLSVGSANDRHPRTGEERPVPAFQQLLILGPDADEGAARGMTLRLGFLEERYRCERFEGALACDASASRP